MLDFDIVTSLTILTHTHTPYSESICTKSEGELFPNSGTQRTRGCLAGQEER